MAPLRTRLGLVAACLLACASPVAIEELPAAAERPVRRIALMPLHVASPEVAPERPDAARVVTARVLEALAGVADLDVVPPEEVERTVAAKLDPAVAVPALHSRFGVDGVLSGVVKRFVTRVGSEAGVTRPASVWLQLELRDPTGAVVWRGSYDETQRSLTEDLGSFSRARERGFRWVSAEELAAYGARELVASLPRAP